MKNNIFLVEAINAGWSGNVPVRRLYENLTAAGVPRSLFPAAPSAHKCLERAVKDVATRKAGYLVRPLPGRAGWTVVTELAEALDREIDPTLTTAHFLSLTVKMVGGNIQATPDDHPMIGDIRERFDYYRTGEGGQGVFVAPLDLSVWFTQRVIPKVQGLPTRSRGGSYYITPGANLNTLEAVVAGLHNASVYGRSTYTIREREVTLETPIQGGKIILKPEPYSEVVAGNMLQSFLAEVSSKMDEYRDIPDQPKAIETRKQNLADLYVRVNMFESLLGTKLDDLKKQLKEVSRVTTIAGLM